MNCTIITRLMVLVLVYLLFQPINTAAQVINTSGPTTFCTGNSVILSVTPVANATYTWLRDGSVIAGQNTHSLVANITGDYQVVLDSAGNCCDTSNTVAVQVLPAPTVSITPSGSMYVCVFMPVLQAAASAGVTYQWYKNGVAIVGETAASYQPDYYGTYHVVVTNPSNCQATSNSVTLNDLPPPVVPITITVGTGACTGSIPLTGTSYLGALSYKWFRNGSHVGTRSTPTFTATQSGSYTMMVNMSSDCSYESDPVSVSMGTRPRPVVTAHGPTELCGNDSVQ